IIGRQHTGGSTAVRGFWNIVRDAGAVGREMMINAAAQSWGISPGECTTRDSKVIHEKSGNALRYGELTARAAQLPVPESAFVKEPHEFRIVGKPTPRVDTPPKVDGSAIFGQDVRLPGMLVATVQRCPVFGGKAKRFNAEATKAIKGVRHVLEISAGIAVVADGFWAASKGRDALEVEWNEGENAALDSAAITTQFRAALDKGVEVHRQGNVPQALRKARKTVEAIYEVPYLAHACMEPMNCTAHVRADGCDLWVPTQAQSSTQQTAMRITGLPATTVKVHTTYLGGGFGRRSEQDFVTDAVELSQATGVPVKVMWTREDDIQHDYYRPATFNKLIGGVDADGVPVAWHHQIAGPSILARVAPNAVKSGLDRTATEGAANLPYAIANQFVSYAMVNPGVPVGFWRSVGSSQNAFITECFFDELAATLGKDPVELRRLLLTEHPRHKAVLELAAEKAGWGSPLPEGRARGIAVAESFGSYVAQVAEVSIENKKVRVHRVVCAIDCGMIVNPDTIAAQMESGIVYGLSAALSGEITIAGGRVQQGNFDSYPMLRIDEMPTVEVHIMPSTAQPGGVGEPGTPPIAPAVANAVFALTGNPVRRLPIRLEA
ncbi:MAG: xanthine dehydrogenase family protein molybdopterin-binding subunit, partial [Pseudomonadota bacterium]